MVLIVTLKIYSVFEDNFLFLYKTNFEKSLFNSLHYKNPNGQIKVFKPVSMVYEYVLI